MADLKAGKQSRRLRLKMASLIFGVALLHAASLGATESNTDARRHAAAHRAYSSQPQGNIDEEQPTTVKIILGVVFGAVLASYLWLLWVKRVGRSVFGPVELPRARWKEWDVVVVFLTFLVVANILGVLVGHTGTETMLMANNIAELLAVCLVLKLVKLRGQAPHDAFGLHLRGSRRHIAAGLAVSLALLPAFVAGSFLWRLLLVRFYGDGFDLSQELVVKLAQTPSLSLMFQIIIAAVLVAPVAEELFFRGFLYGVLRRRVRPVVAMAAVGVLFGVFHSPLAAVVPMCVLGCFLCYIYENTARLTVPIAIHFLFNLGQVALIIALRSFGRGVGM